MAGGDIYELTLHQLDRGQVCENVFYFEQRFEFVTTDPTHAQVLAENWRDQILPSISACQPAEVLTTGVSVKNLFDVSDGYDLALSIAGGFATDRQMESTFNAIGFKLNGNNPAVKNGSKRFAGVFEDYVDDGVITGATLLTVCNTLGTKIATPVTVGLIIFTDTFFPCIVKRIRSGTPGNYTYRLPETRLETVFSSVVVALLNVIITSQLSRKIGVGV